MNDNQDISKAELVKIRCLTDLDLTMLISEVHDHGWLVARRTLLMMPVRTPTPLTKAERALLASEQVRHAKWRANQQ